MNIIKCNGLNQQGTLQIMRKILLFMMVTMWHIMMSFSISQNKTGDHVVKTQINTGI